MPESHRYWFTSSEEKKDNIDSKVVKKSSKLSRATTNIVPRKRSMKKLIEKPRLSISKSFSMRKVTDVAKLALSVTN